MLQGRHSISVVFFTGWSPCRLCRRRNWGTGGWDLAEVSGEDRGVCGSPMCGRVSRQHSLRSEGLRPPVQAWGWRLGGEPGWSRAVVCGDAGADRSASRNEVAFCRVTRAPLISSVVL